jgi:hypothetical protein
MTVPVLQDEINRKAFETIAWLTLAVTSGKISPEQFSTGIDSLFMATSGLVTDRDYIIMITEAQSLIEREKQHGRSKPLSARQSEAHSSPGAW